jgi:hypothetical protein
MEDDFKVFEREIDLVEDAINALAQRMEAAEEAHSLLMAPLEAAAATQKSVLTGIQALVTSIHALEAPIGEASLAAVLGRIDAVSAENRALSQEIGRCDERTGAQVHEFQRKEVEVRSQFDTQLAQIRSEIESRFAAQTSINPCGCYDPNKAYRRGDLVELNGSSYISTENGNKEKPSKKSKRWMLSAARGGSIVLGANNTDTTSGGLTIIAEDADSVTVETA